MVESTTSEANPLQLVERTCSNGSSSCGDQSDPCSVDFEEEFDWKFLDDLI
jgi:hypothetical protein